MTIITDSCTGTRQHFSAQSVPDGSGGFVITFLPPTGQFWTGGVTVYDSTDNVQWMVAINGLVVDVVLGAATTSALQLGPNDVLTLSTKTGAAGTTYHATLSVVVTPENNTNLIIPAHDPFHQPIAMSVLTTQTIAPYVSGPVPFFNFTVPNNVNGIEICGEFNYNDQIIVTDPATGYVWHNSNTGLGGAFSPVYINPVPGTTLQISYQNNQSSAIPIQVIALTDQLPRTTSQIPVFTRDKYDGLPVTVINQTVAAGGAPTILPAPPAGNVYDIKVLAVNAGTTAFNAGQACYLRTLTVGALILGNYAQANGIFINQSYDKFYLNDGLVATNSWSSNASFGCLYRVIPVWYSLS